MTPLAIVDRKEEMAQDWSHYEKDRQILTTNSSDMDSTGQQKQGMTRRDLEKQSRENAGKQRNGIGDGQEDGEGPT